MAVIKGRAYRVQFQAWDSTGSPKTGDAANITVRIRKDGGSLTATTNSCVEIDATNAPGWYEVELTASEMTANSIFVAPQSSTSGVSCESLTILTSDVVDPSSSPLIVTSSGYARAHVAINDDKTGYQLDMSQTLPASPTANTTGRALKNADTNLDATVSSRSTLTAADVWSYTTRTLTSFGTLVSDIWNHSTRTLTSFGTLVSDIWNHSTRTLTSFGTLVSDVASAVWSYTVEGTFTALQWFRLLGAYAFGKRTRDPQTGTENYYATNDTTVRITGTVDNDLNRNVTTRNGN